jgi:hypothetical protein
MDEALIALAQFDQRESRLVHLHYLGGFTAEESTEVPAFPSAPSIANGISRVPVFVASSALQPESMM